MVCSRVALACEIIALGDQIAQLVLLRGGRARARLDLGFELLNLLLQRRQLLLCVLLFDQRRLDRRRRAQDVVLQLCDRALVLGGELDGGRRLGRRARDVIRKLAALFDQPLLRLVRLFQRAVERLILKPEVLELRVRADLEDAADPTSGRPNRYPRAQVLA